MKKFRQIIQNFAYSGELTNTTVIEWIDGQRQGDARNATAEDLAQIGDSAAAGYIAQMVALKETHAAEISKLHEEITALIDPPTPSSLAFKALPEEIQSLFRDSYDTAELLMEAGRTDLAIAHVEALIIPTELEQVRDQIVTLLKGG